MTGFDEPAADLQQAARSIVAEFLASSLMLETAKATPPLTVVITLKSVLGLALIRLERNNENTAVVRAIVDACCEIERSLKARSPQ